MKASISVLTTAVIVGVISAASNWVMAAPITYDFTGPVLGNQALGASHTYTAAGGPDITAISGSYAQLGSEAPVPVMRLPLVASWSAITTAAMGWELASASAMDAITAISMTILRSTPAEERQ